MRPSPWVGLNIKPLETPGTCPFPKSRTIPIMFKRAMWRNEEKPFPIMFYYVFILWTGLLDDKSVLLQNHNSWEKTSMEFPSLCYYDVIKTEKSKKTNCKPDVFDLWWLLCYEWQPNNMPTSSFIISNNCSFAKKKNKEKTAWGNYPCILWLSTQLLAAR